ncbi:MAG: hypothetical protein R2778_10020 [Saprospiraceae bacterium]
MKYENIPVINGGATMAVALIILVKPPGALPALGATCVDMMPCKDG